MIATRWAMLLVLAPLLACANHPPVTSAPDSTALLSAYEQYRQAWIKGDTTAALASLSNDVHVLISGVADIAGKDSARKLFVDEMATYDVERLQLDHQDVIVSGDYAIVVGRYDEIQMPKRRGPPIQNVGRYMTIWRKEAGTWRIARYMLNDLPATH